MKIQKNKGGRVGGGQGRCEQRSEVFFFFFGGGGLVGGGQDGCKRIIEVFVKK